MEIARYLPLSYASSARLFRSMAASISHLSPVRRARSVNSRISLSAWTSGGTGGDGEAVIVAGCVGNKLEARRHPERWRRSSYDPTQSLKWPAHERVEDPARCHGADCRRSEIEKKGLQSQDGEDRHGPPDADHAP